MASQAYALFETGTPVGLKRITRMVKFVFH